MTALLATILLASQEPPRSAVRELPNGVTTVAERSGPPGRFVLMLGAFGPQETAETQGHRHLLEHLVAKGPGGTADARLEAEGAFIGATTTRFAIEVAIQGPDTSIATGLAVLKEIASSLKTSDAEIAREVGVIGQERRLLSREYFSAALSWRLLTTPYDLDPAGFAADGADISLKAIESLFASTFVGRNIVVVMIGNLSPDMISDMLANAFGSLPAGEAYESATPRANASWRGAENSRAVVVPGIGSPDGMAAVAGAFALAEALGGESLLYTPSLDDAVATVYSSKASLVEFDANPEQFVAPYVEFGVAALASWLNPSDPFARAQLRVRCRGAMMPFDPVSLSERARGLDRKAVLTAAARFAAEGGTR